MSDLRIRVGADVAPALDGLRQLETRMRTTTAAGQTFGKGLEQTTKSLQKLPQTSSAATQSLVNLSRVAQDAPFGFIGIANNLNPLLESFQRLRASTGSTAGAMAALKSSLMGPAGLGLAIGVVSSLLITFGDKLFGAKANMTKFQEALNSAKDSFVEAVSNVSRLTNEIELAKQGFLAKDSVVKSYNDTIGKTTGFVNSLDEAEQKLVRNAKGYIGMMLQKAIAAKAFEKSAEKLFEIEENNIAVQEATKNVGDYFGSIFKAGVDKSNSKLKTQSEAFLEIANRANKAAAIISKLFNLNYFQDTKPIKVEKPKENKQDIVPILGLGDSDQALFSSIERIFSQVQDRVNFRLKNLFKGKKGFDLTGGSAKEKGLIPDDSIEKTKEQLEQLAKIGVEIGNIFASAFDGLFQALIKGQNAIQAFGQAFIQALTGVISKLIQTAILAAIVSALGGGITTATGTATGFKDIFSALSGFGGFRAGGGPVEAGKTYAVGERGMELFTPSVSGRIIPNNQIGGLSLGGRSSGGGSVVLRGRELRLLGVRTTNSQIRLGVRA